MIAFLCVIVLTHVIIMNRNLDTPINRSNGSDNSHNNRSSDIVSINIKVFNMQSCSRGKCYLAQNIVPTSDIVCVSKHALYEEQFYQLYNIMGSLGYEGFLHQSGDLNSATYTRVRGHCGVGIF